MKCSLFVYFFVLIYFANADDNEKCENCVQLDHCSLYKEMTQQEQRIWVQKYSCRLEESSDSCEEDCICCPDSENSKDSKSNNYNQFENIEGSKQYVPSKLQQNNKDSYEYDQEYDYNYEPNSYPQRPNNQRPNSGQRPRKPRGPNNNNSQNSNRPVRYPNDPRSRYPNNNNPNMNGNYGGNAPNNNGQNYGPSSRPNYGQNYGNRPNPQGSYPSYNNGPNYNAPNGNYPNPARPNGNPNWNLPNAGAGAGQCSNLINTPPSPQTGCCGHEATNDRSTSQNGYMNRPAPRNQYGPPYRRYVRDIPTTDSIPDITLDSRIAGGKETDLLQFPWAVFLKTTFDYGAKKSSFNCGGSLISAYFVLTAGHCISDDNARVSDIDIILAEFDKSTFPTDCVNIRGEGRKCVENIVIKPENIIVHSQYDSVRLQNDIALIKLRTNAPYTEYIRPICLPPINVDSPQYSDLRLAVVGWGRNGTATSQVKQSTVVNLVPQRQCAQSYPHLTQKHICAVGHSGEDTCKGDSGGPLMMLYEGKYYISGIVSGKRADSPCGTNIPSLYTNVFQYMDWINKNIRY